MSGTPLFIALVPAYVSVLWQQAHDVADCRPGGLRPAYVRARRRTAGDLGAYPDVDAANDGLSGLMAPARSEQGGQARGDRRMEGVGRLVHQILILAGFIDPPDERRQVRRAVELRRYLGYAVGIGIWALTWIVPVTFMLMMAFSCESRTKKIFDKAIQRYDTGEPTAGAAR